MNDFTKSILPRMFEFASFVTQLNKYDFHNVKNMDDNIFGEHVSFFLVPLSFDLFFCRNVGPFAIHISVRIGEKHLRILSEMFPHKGSLRMYPIVRRNGTRGP